MVFARMFDMLALLFWAAIFAYVVWVFAQRARGGARSAPPKVSVTLVVVLAVLALPPAPWAPAWSSSMPARSASSSTSSPAPRSRRCRPGCRSSRLTSTRSTGTRPWNRPTR